MNTQIVFAAGFLLVGCGGASGAAPAALPTASLTPLTLSFGETFLGFSSSPQAVVLSNTGAAALQVAQISVTGDFAQDASCAGSSLAPGARCTIQITFTPTRTGLRHGTLKVQDDATGSPQTVSFSGTGCVMTQGRPSCGSGP